MADEVEKKEVNGIVVTVPAGKRAYLISEVTTAFGRKRQKVEPFEKELLEERIAKTLKKVGAKATEIAETIKAKITKGKEELKEAV